MHNHFILQELKQSKAIAIDISNKALKIALENSKINNTFDRIKFINSSIDNFIGFKFDLVVCNPPYIARHQLKNLDDSIKYFEPKIALDGGNDGLDVIRKVIYKSKKILKINGMLALEIEMGNIASFTNFKVKQVENFCKRLWIILDVFFKTRYF